MSQLAAADGEAAQVARAVAEFELDRRAAATRAAARGAQGARRARRKAACPPPYELARGRSTRARRSADGRACALGRRRTQLLIGNVVSAGSNAIVYVGKYKDEARSLAAAQRARQRRELAAGRGKRRRAARARRPPRRHAGCAHAPRRARQLARRRRVRRRGGGAARAAARPGLQRSGHRPTPRRSLPTGTRRPPAGLACPGRRCCALAPRRAARPAQRRARAAAALPSSRRGALPSRLTPVCDACARTPNPRPPPPLRSLWL
jgi:hypothetical protein